MGPFSPSSVPNASPSLHRLLADSSRTLCSGRVLQDSAKSRGEIGKKADINVTLRSFGKLRYIVVEDSDPPRNMRRSFGKLRYIVVEDSDPPRNLRRSFGKLRYIVVEDSDPPEKHEA